MAKTYCIFYCSTADTVLFAKVSRLSWLKVSKQYSALSIIVTGASALL